VVSTHTPPRFEMGMPVVWNRYFGLVPKGETDPHRNNKDDLREMVIVGCRLIPEWDETDEGDITLAYLKGWEYVVARPGGRVTYWLTEAELMAAGYGGAA